MNIILKSIVFLLFIFLVKSTFAQNKENDIHRFQLGLSFDVYDKVKMIDAGKSVFKSNYTPSSSFNFNYSYYIKDIVGFNAGVGFTVLPHTLRYDFRQFEDGVTLYNLDNVFYQDTLYNETFYNFMLNAFILSFSVEKRFLLTKKHYMYAASGININFITSYPYTLSRGYSFTVQNSTLGSDSYRVFDYEIHESKSPVIAAFFFKIGYYKQFEKGNTLGFNFKLNYSPQLLGEGTYKFSNFAYESYGDLKWNVNHVGVEMVYGFLPIKNKKKQKQEESQKF